MGRCSGCLTWVVYSGSDKEKVPGTLERAYFLRYSAATDEKIEVKGHRNPLGASALVFGCSRVKDLARIPANSPVWLQLRCPTPEMEEMPSFLY
jgi:hypothetical protein